MNTLRSRLNDLASSFANGVLDAIRGASIDELTGESGRTGGTRRGPGRPRGTPSAAPKAARSGRLARRSAADIAKSLDAVVALVKKNKAGMRSEQIRKSLDLDVREVPRILKEGIAKKKLRSKGQKRATTYFSA